MKIEGTMIHQDPNHLFMSILGLVVGTYFTAANWLIDHTDMAMKLIMFVLGVVSYSITIYKNIKRKK